MANRIERALQRLLSEVPREEWGWLLSPRGHISLLASRRATLIISRVQVVATLLAILTALWIVPDLILLPWPVAGYLSLARVAAGAAFLFVAFGLPESVRMRDAYVALAGMYAVATGFFVASYWLLGQVDLNGLGSTIAATYAFIPLLMLAGLGMFPLTALECVLYSLPVLAAEIACSLCGTKVLELSTQIGEFWLAMVLIAVAALSGMSQLGFMIALVRQAIHDPLTGSFSRASGQELLEIQFIIAIRSRSPLAVAFFDLDNFKSVNDQYGHEAGDVVLKAMTESIRGTLRTGDMLARWGGEEFIVILPNSYVRDAVNVIERIRERGLGTRPDGKPVTASIGLAERTADEVADWRDLVEKADQRMYAAKKAGKDRIVWNDSLESVG